MSVQHSLPTELENLDAWAEVYDSVHADLTADIPFYVEEARRSGGPVLELGCGTGRVALPIARAGIETVGLDVSPKMLDAARRKAAELTENDGPLLLLQRDMRELALDRAFGLVIVPFNGFLSLLSVEDQVRTLSRVRDHLAPDGRLVFDIFVPDPDMLVQEGDVPYHLRDVTRPDTGERLVLWHQSRYDHHNQVIDVRVIVESLDDAGAVSRRLYRDFQVRYAHRWEVEHLLARCGYEVVDLYGDFDRAPFDEDSRQMIWVARSA